MPVYISKMIFSGLEMLHLKITYKVINILLEDDTGLILILFVDDAGLQ